MVFLSGEAVNLRTLEPSDAEQLVVWLNNPELRRFLSVRFPITAGDETAWLQSHSTAGADRRDVVLGITIPDGDNQILIGTAGLHAIDWIRRRAMTGIVIGPPEYRSRGFGTAAKNLMMDYAFGELGLHSLWAEVLADNHASLRALEKQGYRRGSVLRQAAFMRGEWCDMVYLDVLADEWRALRESSGNGAGKSPIRR